MALTPEHRAKLLASTRAAAIALVEDLEHLRAVVGTLDPASGELRRISAVLRRLFVDGDLSLVATPRTGRVMLKAPDNNPVYRHDRTSPMVFYASGGAVTFGVWMRASMVHQAGRPSDMPDFNPEKFIELPLDGFLNQRVLCLQGKWVSRRALIKYIANTASGVHSNAAESDEEKLIERMRLAAVFGSKDVVVDGGATVKAAGLMFDMAALRSLTQPIVQRPGTVDAVLVEMLCTAHFLLESQSVADLDAAIRSEVSLPPGPRPAS